MVKITGEFGKENVFLQDIQHTLYYTDLANSCCCPTLKPSCSILGEMSLSLRVSAWVQEEALISGKDPYNFPVIKSNELVLASTRQAVLSTQLISGIVLHATTNSAGTSS